MQVIIVRHGDEKRLQAVEREAARHEFGKFIDRLSLQQQGVVVFSSSSGDAQLTTAVVVERLKVPNATSLNELSDRPSSDLVESILDEVEKEALKQPGINTADTWVLIGHHPRLSQFLARVTGTRQRPLGHLHAVCVSAADPTKLRLGQGKIEWRYPILDVEGDKLGAKLQSKMVVGALLAGFDFTALLELLKEPEKTPVIKGTSLLTTQRLDYVRFWEWNELQWDTALNSLTIFCLSVALVLFIASVYIFDTLAMPEGFLAFEPQKPCLVKKRGRFHNHVIWLGFVYTSMIHTWRWLFSPAVGLSALAALLLVGRLHSGWLLGIWSGLIALAILYYFLWKPRGMID